VVNATPGRFTPGNDPVPNVQDARWAEVPVWAGKEISPHRDSMPGPFIPQRVAIPATVHEVKVMVKQYHYKPGQAQRLPGS